MEDEEPERAWGVFLKWKENKWNFKANEGFQSSKLNVAVTNPNVYFSRTIHSTRRWDPLLNSAMETEIRDLTFQN